MATAAKKNTPLILINTGASGVVYNEAGDSVGGGERAEIPEINPVAQAALNIGQLMLAPAQD